MCRCFILMWWFALSLITKPYRIHRKLMEIGHASRTFWERNVAGQVSLNYIEPQRCATRIHDQPMNSTIRRKSVALLLHGLNPDSEDVGIPLKLLCLSITRYYKWANPVDTCWYTTQIASWTVLLLTWLVQIPFLASLMSDQRLMKVRSAACWDMLRCLEHPWIAFTQVCFSLDAFAALLLLVVFGAHSILQKCRPQKCKKKLTDLSCLCFVSSLRCYHGNLSCTILIYRYLQSTSLFSRSWDVIFFPSSSLGMQLLELIAIDYRLTVMLARPAWRMPQSCNFGWTMLFDSLRP